MVMVALIAASHSEASIEKYGVVWREDIGREVVT